MNSKCSRVLAERPHAGTPCPIVDVYTHLVFHRIRPKLARISMCAGGALTPWVNRIRIIVIDHGSQHAQPSHRGHAACLNRIGRSMLLEGFEVRKPCVPACLGALARNPPADLVWARSAIARPAAWAHRQHIESNDLSTYAIINLSCQSRGRMALDFLRCTNPSRAKQSGARNVTPAVQAACCACFTSS